jgi:hypothetical protein
MKISLDWDGVCTSHNYNIWREYPKVDEPRKGFLEFVDWCNLRGHEIIILSARKPQFGMEILDYIKNWGLVDVVDPITGVIFNTRDKAERCQREGVDIHVDDHPSIQQQFFAEGLETICIPFTPEGKSLLYPVEYIAKDFDTVVNMIKEIEDMGKRSWSSRTMLRPEFGYL